MRLRHVTLVAAMAFVCGSRVGTVPPIQVEVPRTQAFEQDVRRGPGVTSVRRLAEYLPSLAGTAGDTAVYVLDSGTPGATALVVGGTHANEVAGFMSAIVLVEQVRVAQGRLIVVPQANNSALTWVDPRRRDREWISVRSPRGDRRFRAGARLTNPAHQGRGDPPKFRHPVSTEELDGAEARNLDRSYPGNPDGTLTERIAAAIMRVLAVEHVDLAFDLHEAPPGSRLAWTLVAHPRGLELAASAVLALDALDVPIKLERSSDTFRGLSHREWGDALPVRAFLMETANPAMAAERPGGDAVDDPVYPLSRRVAVHLAVITAIIDAHNDQAVASGRLAFANMPAFAAAKSSIGALLR